MNGDWLSTAVCFPAALFISFFTSMTGVSGAFVLVPFQISILGISGPVVSSTNHLYNVIATPGGVFRIYREGRIDRQLLLRIGGFSLPGALLGSWIRVRFLPGESAFFLFAGLVLLLLGLRLIADAVRLLSSRRAQTRVDSQHMWRDLPHSVKKGQTRFSGRLIALLSLIAGLVGGAYGIGGGVVMAPILVTLFKQTFDRVAGALLGATFIVSLGSILTYQLLGYVDPSSGASPNWMLGISLGLGGLLGTYAGSRCQRHVDPFWLRLILALSVLTVALRYLWRA